MTEGGLCDSRAEIADGEISSGILADLWAHWRSLRTDGGVPRRSAFDPMRIPALLPSIFLFGAGAKAGRYQVRVFGTRLCACVGRELTGQYLDEAELPESMRRQLLSRVTWREPFVLRGEASLGGDGVLTRYEVLGLPMADGDGSIAFVLGGMDFEDGEKPADLGGSPLPHGGLFTSSRR